MVDTARRFANNRAETWADRKERIKSYHGVLETVQQYVPALRRVGRDHWVALCPFHTERRPSFHVTPSRGSWHCFGACQRGGDVIEFMRVMNKLEGPGGFSRTLALFDGGDLTPLVEPRVPEPYTPPPPPTPEQRRALAFAGKYYEDGLRAGNVRGFVVDAFRGLCEVEMVSRGRARVLRKESSPVDVEMTAPEQGLMDLQRRGVPWDDLANLLFHPPDGKRSQWFGVALTLADKAQLYLYDRGVTWDDALRLNLGFGRPGLIAAASQHGVSLETLLSVGLVSDEKKWEKLRERIVIPDIEIVRGDDGHAMGQVTWLTGRLIADHERYQPYMNITMPKPLLGLGRLASWTGPVVLVEGPFDWVASRCAGLPAVAVLGAGSEQVASDLEHVAHVVCAMDADKAGAEYTEKLAEEFSGRVSALPIPLGVNDPGDLHKRVDGLRAWREAYEQHVAEFVIASGSEGSSDGA